MTDHFDDDAFWDDPDFDPDRTSQIQRVQRRSVERTRTHHVVRREQPLEQLDEDTTIWLEPSSTAARRLGPLGAVDPRVLSIGAVILAAVLAVPLFGALGDGGNGDDDLRAVHQQSTTTTSVVPVAVTPSSQPTDVVVVTGAVEGSGELEVETPSEPAPEEGADADGATAESGADEAPPALPDDPDCANKYEAAAGDYWLRIADASGTELDALLDVNSATPETPIYPGSTICLPGGAALPAAFADDADGGASVAAALELCPNIYESVAGDYWLRIADAANLELDELLALNNATADTPLYPGSEVCLPVGASGPPPPTTAAPTSAPASTASPTTPAPATTDPPTTAAPATTQPPTTESPSTTDRPTSTEPPPPPPPAGDIEQIIRDVWPDELEDQALRIAWRESSYNPYAQNFCCSGLFQIYYEMHAGWLVELGVDERSDLYDPLTNARAAYALYQRSGGWAPWRMTAD